MKKVIGGTMFNCELEYLEKIFENCPEARIDGYSAGDIENSFDLQPKDFLNFAELDIQKDDFHHLVNCLTNSKRAIECQIDSLLFRFGLLEISRKKRWFFPEKIEVLNQIGIISPRILTKVNSLRNFLEHRYSKPEKEKVEDALDVALLFIGYTDRYLKNTVTGFVILDPIEGRCDMTLDHENNKIVFNLLVLNETTNEYEGKLIKEVEANSGKYLDYVKWYLGQSIM